MIRICLLILVLIGGVVEACDDGVECFKRDRFVISELNILGGDLGEIFKHSRVRPRHKHHALFIEQGVPVGPLQEALDFFRRNKDRFRNKKYITIVDFRIRSSLPRMFVLDLESGEVMKYLVAHGRGSDPDNDGYVESFSNEKDSNQSSSGFYRTRRLIHNVKNGNPLIALEGLSETNSNALDRDILIHPSDYVKYIAPGTRLKYQRIGRSNGCLAMNPEEFEMISGQIEKGSLYYVYPGLKK